MIREMLSSDLDRVLEVENTAHVIPWEFHHFNTCLNAGHNAIVLEIDERIEGYAIFQFVSDETTLMNIAVHDAQQGKGYGQLLMAAYFEAALEQGCKTAFLEVRESNQRAAALYEYLGYEQIGFRKDYYPALDGREGALILMKNL